MGVLVDPLVSEQRAVPVPPMAHPSVGPVEAVPTEVRLADKLRLLQLGPVALMAPLLVMVAMAVREVELLLKLELPRTLGAPDLAQRVVAVPEPPRRFQPKLAVLPVAPVAAAAAEDPAIKTEAQAQTVAMVATVVYSSPTPNLVVVQRHHHSFLFSM